MKAEEFRRLTAALENLTPHQKQLLTDRLRAEVRAVIESRVGATRHLAHYLGWRRLIERCNNAPQPRNVLLAALGVGQVQQLTVT